MLHFIHIGSKTVPHCAVLFLLIIIVSLLLDVAAADEPQLIIVEEWQMPYRGPKYLFAQVGDTIEFRWNKGNHNVNIHPQIDGRSTCAKTNAIPVGDTSPSRYTFTQEDAGKEITGGLMFFSCDVGSHCKNGQNLKVRVKVRPEDRLNGLSTDTCNNKLPTSTGLAATPCNLPEDQICCYGVQIATASVCRCNGTLNGWRTYTCDYRGKPEDCPADQNPNLLDYVQPMRPTLRPITASAITIEEEDSFVVPAPVLVLEPVPAVVEEASSVPSFSPVFVASSSPPPTQEPTITTQPPAVIITPTTTQTITPVAVSTSSSSPMDDPIFADDTTTPVVQTTKSPSDRPSVEEKVAVEDCVGKKCDPSDRQSCSNSCQPGLLCRRSRINPTYVCSVAPRKRRSRLFGEGVGGAATGRIRGARDGMFNF